MRFFSWEAQGNKTETNKLKTSRQVVISRLLAPPDEELLQLLDDLELVQHFPVMVADGNNRFVAHDQ
jgi:hypothetical protein